MVLTDRIEKKKAKVTVETINGEDKSTNEPF